MKKPKQIQPVKFRSARERVLAWTNQGEDLIQFFVRVYQGDDTESGFSGRDRLEAAKTLLDRAYGRAPETVVNLNASLDPDTEGIAAEALEDMIRGLSGTAAPSLPAPRLAVLEAEEPEPLEALDLDSLDSEDPE